MQNLLSSLEPRDAKTGLVRVVVDTPRGSRNKLKYDEELGCFTLSRILPVGHVFPYDFGSVPGTRAPDGDALDVLVLLEAPSFPGCVVTVKLIGGLAAEQTDGGETLRNDRLIGAPQTRPMQQHSVISMSSAPPASTRSSISSSPTTRLKAGRSRP
jgi:inorganic pyrophosphatase